MRFHFLPRSPSLAGVGLTLALLLGPSMSAHAQWAVIDAMAVKGLQAVVDAVRGNATAIQSATSNAAKQIAESNANLQSRMEMDRQEDRFRHPTGCDVVAASRGMADTFRLGGGGAGSYGGPGSRPGFKSGSPNIDTVLKQLATGNTYRPSAEVQAAQGAAGACELFGDSGSQVAWRSEACERAGFARKKGDYPRADITSATVFMGPQKTAEPTEFRKYFTLTDDKERTAYSMYVRNISSPIEPRALTQNELRTEAGRQYMAFYDAYKARLSMSMAPYDAIATSREQRVQTKAIIEQLLRSDTSKNYVKTYLDANVKDWDTKGISQDELLNLEVERRYMNKDWHVNMAGLPGEPLAKEQAILTAFQNVLLWRMIQAQDMSNAVLGNISATLVRQEMSPQLNALAKAVAR